VSEGGHRTTPAGRNLGAGYGVELLGSVDRKAFIHPSFMHTLSLRILASISCSYEPARKLLAAVKEQGELAAMAGWSFASALIARSANLLALVICARVLSQEQFGQVAII